MTGKVSTFGSLAQRGVAGSVEQAPAAQKRRVRHVFVAITVGNSIFERPGVLLDWAQEPSGWVARVAYVADEQGTLIVAWFTADLLTPVPD